MSLLFATQDEGGGSFTEQLAFKSYHFLDTIVVFKPRFLLPTHAKRFVKFKQFSQLLPRNIPQHLLCIFAYYIPLWTDNKNEIRS